MTFNDVELAFAYRKCCRVHKILISTRLGPCGICGEVPGEVATLEEYEAQEPLPIAISRRPESKKDQRRRLI